MKVENWIGYDIRFVEHNDEWWAVAKDVTDALGLVNTTDVVRKGLKENEVALADLDIIYPSSGEVHSRNVSSNGVRKTQTMNIISEKGIYRLAFKSRKKEAEAFQDWVFSVIKYLREQSGLEGFEVFKTMDTEFQKTCMDRLHDGLPVPTRGDYCKANMITNKAVANVFAFDVAVKKDDMTPPMLKLRHKILPYTVDLIVAKERFGLDISVSENVYNKAYKIFNNMEE